MCFEFGIEAFEKAPADQKPVLADLWHQSKGRSCPTHPCGDVGWGNSGVHIPKPPFDMECVGLRKSQLDQSIQHERGNAPLPGHLSAQCASGG